MNSTLRSAGLALLVSLALSSCATGTVRQDANSHVDHTEAYLDGLKRASAARRIPVSGPIITDAPYVDVTPIQKAKREPVAFNRIVSFNTAGEMSMHAFASRVESMTGVKVRYQSELVTGDAAVAGAMALPSSSAPLVVNGVTLPTLDATVGVSRSPVAAGGVPGVHINYSGPLRGLFEQVSEQTGAYWKWNATSEVVDFYKYETEAFRVAAVQGESKTSFELGRSQNTGSNENTLRLADTESSHQTPGTVWKDIEQTLGKLVGSEGVFQVNQAGGMVVVRDAPDRMRLVRDYFDTLNTMLSRQVDIDVTIYRVHINDSDFKGVSWNVLFQTLFDNVRYNVNLTTPRPDVVSQNASSAVIRIPKLGPDGTPNRFGESQLFLDALSTVGRTSVEQSTSVLTSNNRAAAAKFVRRNTYLAETVPTYASGGGTSVGTGAGLTPGSVETGLNLYLLPHVQDDGKRLLLRAMVSISNLDAMETYSSGDQSIQLPQVSSRELAPEAWLTSGDTLVVTDFTQIESGNTSKSPFGRLWGLGGERSINHGREMLVITMTPVVSASRSQI